MQICKELNLIVEHLFVYLLNIQTGIQIQFSVHVLHFGIARFALSVHKLVICAH